MAKIRATILHALVLISLLLPAQVFADGVEAADKLVVMRRYHEAIEVITQFIDKQPGHPTAYMVLGKAQFHLSRFKDAMVSFHRAIGLDSRLSGLASGFFARMEFWYGNDTKARAHLKNVSPDRYTARGLPHLLDPAGMKRRGSKHYIVYVDEALARRGGDEFASKIMELVHNTYSKVFRLKREKILHRIYVFSKEGDYRDFWGKVIEKPYVDSKSYYSLNYRVILINADPHGAKTNRAGFTDNAVSTMFCSGFGQFSHTHTPAMPIWFDKGLSTYFGSCLVEGKKVRRGNVIKKHLLGDPHVSRYERLKQSLEDGSLVPLRTLLTMTDEEFRTPYNNQFNINSAHAWSFIQFLLHAPVMKNKGSKLLSNYFRVIHAGRSTHEAYAQSFGKADLRKMETQWLEYVKGL